MMLSTNAWILKRVDADFARYLSLNLQLTFFLNKNYLKFIVKIFSIIILWAKELPKSNSILNFIWIIYKI